MDVTGSHVDSRVSTGLLQVAQTIASAAVMADRMMQQVAQEFDALGLHELLPPSPSASPSVSTSPKREAAQRAGRVSGDRRRQAAAKGCRAVKKICRMKPGRSIREAVALYLRGKMKKEWAELTVEAQKSAIEALCRRLRRHRALSSSRK